MRKSKIVAIAAISGIVFGSTASFAQNVQASSSKTSIVQRLIDRSGNHTVVAPRAPQPSGNYVNRIITHIDQVSRGVVPPRTVVPTPVRPAGSSVINRLTANR